MMKNNYLFTILILGFLAGCLPEKDSPTCPTAQTYDAFLRRCVDDGVTEDANGNHLPFAGPSIIVATGEDTPIAITIPTGSDQDGDSLSYALYSNPLYGTVVDCMNLSGSSATDDRTCTFTNSSHLNGGDYFTYLVNDGQDNSPSVAFVYVTVSAIDDAPAYTYATATGGADESSPATPTYLTLSFVGDEGGVSDEDTQSLSFSLESSDASVIAPARVTVSYGGTPIGASSGPSDYLSLGDGASDGNDKTISLTIFPNDYASSNTAAGNSTITLTGRLNDGTNVASKTMTVKIKSIDNKPFFISVPTPPSVLEGTPISIGPFVVDEGGGYLSNSSTTSEDDSQDVVAIAKVTASPGAYGVGDFTIAATPLATAQIEPNTGSASDDPFSITIRPTSNPDANGKVTLSVSIADGTYTATQTLEVYVTPVNDVPLICDITFADAPSTCTPISSPAAVSEGTPIPTVAVMADEGGHSFEDGQSMTFKIESLNTTTIPNTALSWSYGSVSAGGGTPLALADGNSDSSDTAIFIVVTPNSEINTSLSGPVGIKMSATDSEGALTTSTFYVQVAGVNDNPVVIPDANYTAGVEANEGGTIYNLGFTMDEGGDYDEDLQSLTLTLSSSNTALIPNANLSANYYGTPSVGFTGNLTPVNWGDGVNNSSATGKKLWLNIQPVAGLSGSSNITMSLTDSAGGSMSYVIPVTIDDISALQTGWTEIKSLASAENSMATPIATGYVSLSWGEMVMSGSDIKHYNIYRAIGPDLEDFNFATPIATTANNTVTTFTDTSVSDQTIYWYLVAPVDATSTPTYALPIEPEDRIVRVVVPPKNMVLVHRWMANKEMCTLMGLTADRYNNYRCSYYGPADTSSAYYDQTSDLVVDRYEAGCNYDKSNSGMCTENSNELGCIGEGDPEEAANGYTGIDGSVYYDRESAQCYLSAGGSWYTLEEIADSSNDPDDLSISAVDWQDMEFNHGHLPPLTRVSQAQASSFCSTGRDDFTLENDDSGSSYNFRLPKREEQIAAAAYPTSIASSASTYESGSSLPSTGYCNTNSADGLVYEDGPVPSSSIDTLPGNSTSGIRTVRTASSATQNCLSQYGIQDLIGNVSEWSSERISCTEDGGDIDVGDGEVDTCASISTIDSAFTGTFNIQGAGAVSYNFNGSDAVGGILGTGICGGGEGSDCDAPLVYSAAAYSSLTSATYFNYPSGLPVTTSYYSTGISNVATTASISLYNDTFSLDAEAVSASSNNRAGLLFGGDSDDTDGAGRWNFNVEETSNGAGTYNTDIFPGWNVGFRCVAPVAY